MTETQRVLAQRWRTLATVAAILALAGAVIWVSGRISAEIEQRKMAISEADKRGTAVSTLARDVRELRQQLQDAGETPKVPDPSKAVKDLPARAEVPVPIPGPRGKQGPPGKAAPTITPSPGANGQPGQPGADSTVPGEPGHDGTGVPGKDGQDGKDGTDGRDGAPGQPPAGWSWTDAQGTSYECVRVEAPDRPSPWYECRTTSGPEPPPEEDPLGGLLSLALDPHRKHYP